MNIYKLATQALLAMLNSRWLNNSPCRYGFIGNVDAFDISNLRSEVKQRPDLTVRQLIEEAERFAACPFHAGGLTVLEADGSSHEADIWDVHELRQSLSRKPEDQS